MRENRDKFSIYFLLSRRGYWFFAGSLLLFSLLLSQLPLTHLLGFEFNLFFGFFSAVVSAHWALAALFWRGKFGVDDRGYLGVIVTVWGSVLLALLGGLAVISLNGIWVKNCDYLTGLAYFFLLPVVGSFFGVAFGFFVASVIPRRRWAVAVIYIFPIIMVLWAIYRGLFEPPIFAYDHFFGFFPGSLYDEVREISSTLLLFRLRTVGWAILLFSWVGLVAGGDGPFSTEAFRWKRAVIREKPGYFDGRMEIRPGWGERFVGAVILLLLSGGWLSISYIYRHKIGYVHTSESIRRALGGEYQSEHCRIFYDADRVGPKRLKLLGDDCDFRSEQLAAFFGFDSPLKVRVYWFSDRKQKARFMGAAETMLARPWLSEIYIHNYTFPHSVLKHELAHIYSGRFGAPPLGLSSRYGVFFFPALIEGVAVAADWTRGYLSPHQWSRAMLKMGIAPRPEEILSPIGFFGQASWSAYTVAGSFSRYLIDRYGIEKYKRAYPHAEFERVYRKSLSQLSTEWIAFLIEKVPLDEVAERLVKYRFHRYPSIFSRACPHTVAALSEKVYHLARNGSWRRAIQLQRKLCSYDPRPHRLLYYAELFYRAGDLDRAEREVVSLLDKFSEKEFPVIYSRVASLAGKIAYRKGQVKRAQNFFSSSLKLKPYPSSRRYLKVILYALKKGGPVGEAIFNYLEPEGSYTSALLALQELALKYPKEPMLAYLLGRKYYYLDNYSKAIELMKVVKNSNLEPEFKLESHRIIGMSLFYSRQYAKASRVFSQLLKSAPPYLRRELSDWKERSLWYVRKNKKN